MATAVDRLLEMWANNRFPASEEDEAALPPPPQKQPMTVIEGESIGPRDYPILPQEGDIKSPQSEMVRKNINELINMQAERSEAIKPKMEEARSESREARQRLGKIAEGVPEQMKQYLGKEVAKPVDYSAMIEKYQKMADEEPGKEDTWSMLIETLGPAVLGMLSGSSAGQKAAAETAKGMATARSERQKSDQERVKSRREQAYRGLESLGKLQEGSARMIEAERKANMDSARLLLDAMVKQGDMTKDQASLWADEFEKILSSESAQELKLQDVMAKGVFETAEQEQKALERLSKEEQAMLNREAAEKRFEAGQKGAMDRAKVIAGLKPPTEGERKSASAYSLMSSANNAYENQNERWGYNPTTQPGFLQFQSIMDNLQNPSDVFVVDVLRRVQSPRLKMALDNELSFLAPLLRKESGAAISAGEWMSYRNIYFPRPGDTPEQIEKKRLLREQVLLNASTESGRAPKPEVLIKREEPKYKKQDKKQEPIKLKPKKGDKKDLGGVTYEWDGEKWQPK